MALKYTVLGIVICVIFVLAIYFIVFSTFFQPHKTLAEEISETLNYTNIYVYAIDDISGQKIATDYIIKWAVINETGFTINTGFRGGTTSDIGAVLVSGLPISSNLSIKTRVTLNTLKDAGNGNDYYLGERIFELEKKDQQIFTSNSREGYLSLSEKLKEINVNDNSVTLTMSSRNIVPASIVRYPMYCISWSFNVKNVNMLGLKETLVPDEKKSVIDKCYVREEYYEVDDVEEIKIIIKKEDINSPASLDVWVYDRGFYSVGDSFNEGRFAYGSVVGMANVEARFEV